MKSKESKQRDLFLEDENFKSIKEDEIIFPLCFKNKTETRYLKYLNDFKFECITINETGSSFRGCLMYGFDETIKQVKQDLKLWYHLLIRNHIKIELDEYENFFNKSLSEREKFFTTNEIEYTEPTIENRPEVKHKWKQINF